MGRGSIESGVQQLGFAMIVRDEQQLLVLPTTVTEENSRPVEYVGQTEVITISFLFSAGAVLWMRNQRGKLFSIILHAGEELVAVAKDQTDNEGRRMYVVLYPTTIGNINYQMMTNRSFWAEEKYATKLENYVPPDPTAEAPLPYSVQE